MVIDNGRGNSPLISIVIPCLNEEPTVGYCIDNAKEALAEMGIRGEIIVVDNGSTDDSAKTALVHGAKVIVEPAKGYGNACRRGMQEA